MTKSEYQWINTSSEGWKVASPCRTQVRLRYRHPHCIKIKYRFGDLDTVLEIVTKYIFRPFTLIQVCAIPKIPFAVHEAVEMNVRTEVTWIYCASI